MELEIMKTLGNEQDNLDVDKYGLLASAIETENETVVFYQNLLQMFPEWSEVLQDIIDEELKHVGQLETLRNASSQQVQDNIDDGKDEACKQLAGVATENMNNEFVKYQHSQNKLGATESYFVGSKINKAFEDYTQSIGDPEYWQKKVDYQVEKFGRVGGGLIDKLDQAGFYVFNNKVKPKVEHKEEEIVKDERESEDPEAKEACACEASTEDQDSRASELMMRIDSIGDEADLSDIASEIEVAYGEDEITKDQYNSLNSELDQVKSNLNLV